MILALAGGVGGARMAAGLAQVLPPESLTVVVNTGDDFEHLGLSISPDLDSVMYTLAGRNNAAQGWGLEGETGRCMEALKALGGDTWFFLGDMDLATHLRRTQRLREGATLSQVTRELCAALGVRHTVAPMTDDRVATRVLTPDGELDFQEWFVRRRCEPQFLEVRFDGAAAARPSETLVRALADPELDAVVICPSNPFVSIRPILALPGVEEALRLRRVPVVAVSPIIGNASVKGPLGKILGELGWEVSSGAIARHYGDLVDGIVIDAGDARLAAAIEANCRTRVQAVPSLMKDAATQRRLAEAVVAFARNLARQ